MSQPDTAVPAVDLKTRLALTIKEAAALLGVSPTCIRTMIFKGMLQARKVGGGGERRFFVIPTAALQAWLEGKEEAEQDSDGRGGNGQAGSSHRGTHRPPSCST